MLCCLLCHGASSADLCTACRTSLPWLRHGCRTCAEPIENHQDFLCVRCQQELPKVDLCLASFEYRFPVNQLILAMKQQSRPELLGSLARCLAHHLQERRAPMPDLLLPVPLHASRQRERGFNQAGILAHRLGQHLQIPVRHDLLIKRTATRAQKTLSREQRQVNLANAFRLERVKLLRMQPRPRHIALLDDVVTTGATTAALASLLKKAGIRRVDVWALAKTPSVLGCGNHQTPPHLHELPA